MAGGNFTEEKNKKAPTEKIVIIGASELQNPLILKAKEMGFETHVFAWKDGSIGERTADYFYPISIIEKDAILEKCKQIKPKAVVSIASDLANITVNFLSRKLGLVTNSEKSIVFSTNKSEMRKAIAAAHIYTPKFKKVGLCFNVKDFAAMEFPLIVKPTDRSGSRGITKVEKIEELPAAITAAIDYSFEKMAIVEEFIEGEEYSCECISYEGKHYYLAVTKKYTTGSPHFIEIGHIQPTDLDNTTINKVKEEVFKVLDALEIKYGASHSEFKIDRKGNVKIIEIGSRMGGDCIGSDLTPLSTGYDFVRMVIETALGNPPSFTEIYEPLSAGIRYIFTQKDLNILNRLKSTHSKNLFFTSSIKPFEEKEVGDSSSRYGFFIVRCNSPEECRKMCELY